MCIAYTVYFALIFIEPAFLSAPDAEQKVSELREQLNLETNEAKTSSDQCLSLSSEVELLTKELTVSKEGNGCTYDLAWLILKRK